MRGETVGVEWSTIGNAKFETLVDALLARKWRDTAEIIAPDGRGGDAGIDFEVRQGDSRRIYQLKYFPDGFSGDRKSTRQRQIRKSFLQAMKLEPPPVEWTLVIPAKLTPGERSFVNRLAQKVEDGTPAPKITIMDRVELDQLILDSPDVYRYLARDEMRADVELYGLETATLMGGSTLADRLRNLGELADSTDMYWGVDFAREGNSVTHMLRAKDPRAHEKNPITISFNGTFEPQHAELRQQFDRSIRFGASGPVVLPPDVVGNVTVTGPELIAGEYAGVEVRFEPVGNNPALGMPAELRFYDENGSHVTSHEGRISHLHTGSDGFAMRIEFHGHFHIELLYPLNNTQPGHADISYHFRRISAAEALGIEEILTAMNQTDLTCKVYIDDKFAASLAFHPRDASDTDQLVDDIFSIAYDLKIVQEYCRSTFAIPDEITPLDRINLRVARLLLDGYVTASPEAKTGTITLTGTDSPLLREVLAGDGAFVSFKVQYMTFTFGAKELTLKDLLVFHPRAKAINGAEAAAVLDAGRGEGFQVKLQPGEDPYFYLAMPSRMVSPTPPPNEWELALWSLPGITQPGTDTETDQPGIPPTA